MIRERIFINADLSLEDFRKGTAADADEIYK
jgi:hypothetical protein